MENLNVDLTTIGGIIAAVIAIITYVKKFVKLIDDNKEIATTILTVTLGIVAKVSGLGFSTIEWVPFVLTLFVSSSVAQVTYDKVTQPIANKVKKEENETAE